MANAGGGKGDSRGTGGYGGLFGGLADTAKAFTTQAATVAASAAATAAATAQERIETAQGGKKLLDTCGPEGEARLLAKKTANDAVTLDRSVVQKLMDNAMIYEEAAEKMKKAAADADTNDVTDFSRLARDYEARAAKLKVALESLESVPEAPHTTAVEQDAISILVAKGKYKWAAAKTAEGFNTLRRKSADAATSASSAASCPP